MKMFQKCGGFIDNERFDSIIGQNPENEKKEDELCILIFIRIKDLTKRETIIEIPSLHSFYVFFILLMNIVTKKNEYN